MDVVKPSGTTSDAELVWRILAGDLSAEAELVQQYRRGILTIIHQEIRDRSMADDLCQETFRIVLEKVRQGEVREPEKLTGFIAGVVGNLAMNHFRQRSRRESQASLDEAAQLPDPAPSQLDQLLQKEKARAIWQAIGELPSDRDRQVLRRFYIDEHEKERICADLGLTGPLFDVVLCRARKRYKELYQKLVERWSAG
jgi:RNA polymerase sigma-70 factor (ECF subfamily)